MIATLRLEWIGHNTRHVANGPFAQAMRAAARAVPERRTRLLTPKCRPWVAQITGRDARHGLARTFLDGLADYRDANGHGSRGVFLTYVLREGPVYEVHDLISWTRTRRYYCRVDAGKIVELTPDEVATRLDANAATLQSVINRAARA